MTAKALKRDIVDRYDGNPIITAQDIPFPCNTVFNAGAVKHNGLYLLLLRVEGLEGKSALHLATSKDGFHFDIQEKPAMWPSEEEPYRTYEELGVEDPRLTKMGDQYFIFYTAYSRYSPRIGLAKTRDFSTFERVGLVSQPTNKDAVLFPKKFGNRFVRLDRPSTSGRQDMWISYSDDLIYWGDSRIVMEVRPGYWDCATIGAGVPPIETEKGWLEIYHGVRVTAGGRLYRLGCALFDLEDPSKLIGRSGPAILSPREPYERTGDVPNVVFTCGAVMEENGEVRIYYGAADTCICVATASLHDLIDCCE
ncbi:MAG: hypothetical protein AMS15_03275 [Planctomycetes bacterium DG_23]|nr:MAG: hypothetical protein AMS15_03275 [Planctomycetes bacterium DG_23]